MAVSADQLSYHTLHRGTTHLDYFLDHNIKKMYSLGSSGSDKATYLLSYSVRYSIVLYWTEACPGLGTKGVWAHQSKGTILEHTHGCAVRSHSALDNFPSGNINPLLP